ncbi:hypothetical protein [Chryseobacterium indoltheticum]|uniref:Lipoprotein n=1 Tax=Chryseobacterium indoltheticum TaxID=254 RepID=A0A381FAZ9_9FLAO|nr:hypothetical protein [Chryseobacterium indoltheticum]SUX43750.1 Uncharacterised protein [Chryseobacterium indoltheticum]
MKKLILLPSLIFLCSCEDKKKEPIDANSPTDTSQQISSKDSLNKNNSPQTIEETKAEYALVNNQLIAKKLDSASFDYECDEVSGNVVYYSSNGELKSIKHFHGDSHFSSVENYYLKNGKPFFVFQEETVWNFDGGTPEKPETKDDVEEKRFYYINDKLISCRDKKYTLRTKNQSKPENVSDGESKKCNDTELRKTFEVLLKNKDKKGKTDCIL